MRAAALLVTILLLPALPPPAAAESSGSFAGAGWVAARVRVLDGFALELDFEGEWPGEHLARGLFVYEGAAPLLADVRSYVEAGSTDYRVAATDAGLDVAQRDARADLLFRVETDVTCAGCVGSVYVVVGVIAGDVEGVRWRLGGAGFETLGLSAGPGAFAHRAEDFEGVHAAAASGPQSARVSLDARQAAQASGTLVAAFVGLSTLPGSQASVDAPSGTRACPCVLGPGDGAGAYTFRAREASRGDFVLVGADVALPPG